MLDIFVIRTYITYLDEMRRGRRKAGSNARAVPSRRAWCAVGALSKNTAAAAAQVLLKILGVRLMPDTAYGGLEPALGEP